MAAAITTMLSIVVKNTFVSVEDEADEEMRKYSSQRSISVPPCARLATGSPAATSITETEAIVSDDSTDLSDGGETTGDKSNSSSCSACSVELGQRTPLNVRANLYKPRQLPSIPLPLPPGPLIQNAEAQCQSWSSTLQPVNFVPAVCEMGLPAKLEIPEPPEIPYKKPTRTFRHLCFKAAAAVREVLSDHSKHVKIVEGVNHWSVIADVLPESIGHEDKLRTLAKEAIIGSTRSIGKMCILGYRRKPFATIPFGFSASLAPVPTREYACWGAFARGCCTNGDACRWEHPSCASTVSVIIHTSSSE